MIGRTTGINIAMCEVEEEEELLTEVDDGTRDDGTVAVEEGESEVAEFGEGEIGSADEFELVSTASGKERDVDVKPLLCC